MADTRSFDRQVADRCWQLAWQSFDLKEAQKLNAMGNKLAARARELRAQSKQSQRENLGDSGYDKRKVR